MTGSAVAATPLPSSSAWAADGTPSTRHSPGVSSRGASANPAPTDAATAATPIRSTRRSCPRSRVCGTSSPTRNVKSTSASVPNSPRNAADPAGNTSWVAPAPRTVGPIRMPAAISPTTRGWRSRTASVPTSRAATTMIARSASTAATRSTDDGTGQGNP